MKSRRTIRISVVIAAYNAAATISDALRSVLDQSFTPLEIIVVDDCSTDHTTNVLKAYRERITMIRLAQNSGPALARNVGIERAAGTHIAFLDADDRWHKDKLLHVAAALEQQSDLMLLFHDYALKDEPVADQTPALLRVSLLNLLRRNLIATPCAVVRNVPGMAFEPRMRYMEDYDLWLRLAMKQPVWRLPLPLTVLGRPVLSPGGQSSRRWKMRQGELKAFTRLALRKKSILPALPLLWAFSLAKHVRGMLRK